MELSVPIQFFIDAQQKGYGKKLQLFLFLKLVYSSGKTQLSAKELQWIASHEKIKCRSTLLKHLDFLIEKGWIRYNAKTGYYLLKSFDSIRKEQDWKVRLAFPVDYSSYRNIKAITGAILYGYLHKDFWRKVRRKKSVQIKGSTYHFLSPKFKPQNYPAPLSVLGTGSIFKISPSTASRLKDLAQKHHLLEVQKNYDRVPNKKAMLLCLKYNDKRNNIVFHHGNYRLQLIDTVLPLFLFKKREKLKT